MKNQDLLHSLELLNKELLELKNSREYTYGKNLLMLLSILKKRKILLFLKKILQFFIKNRSKVKVHTEFNEIPNILTNSYKVVIYTCITGNYDDIQEPLYVNDSYSYFLFTNNKNLKSKIWNVVYIDEPQIKDNILLNRYIKLHPHKFLKGFDFSIYIDGNIRLVSDIGVYVSFAINKLGLSMHKHRERNCLYDEAEILKIYGKGNKDYINKQISQYKIKGFPRNFGLLEANLIIVDLKNRNSIKILNEWWEDFFYMKSYRDQLSLPYILWKNNYTIDDVGIIGNNIYQNSKLQIVDHRVL